MILMAVLLPAFSRRILWFGKMGVRSSKFFLFIASAGRRPLIVETYSRALNFSPWVFTLVFPVRISPVFSPNLLI